MKLAQYLNNSCETHNFKVPENVVTCKYYNLEKIQIIKIPNKKSSLSLFHIYTCSLSNNFEDPKYLLKKANNNIDIIAISETRIIKNTKIMKNINIPNFSYEFTSTESTAEGTLLYTADYLPYKMRNDLNLYKKNYLESTFAEITNLTKTNITVECI